MMRVALMQAASPAGDIETALAEAERALAAAGAAGAEIVVLPECWLPGYNDPRIPDLALPAEGPWLDRLTDATKTSGCALAIGHVRREGNRLRNAALALSAEGAVLARYSKIQLFGPREAALYTPGDSYATFMLGGRLAALLICYDIEFAPHVAALAAMGVELILVPTANMQPFTPVVEATVPAMAASHGLAIVYANYCGIEGDLTYIGGSLVAGPHGEVLARAGPGPALLIADLPEPDPARLSTQSRDFRPIA